MRILLVDDEPGLLQPLTERLLTIPEVEVDTARSRESGIRAIASEEYDFIVCDLRIPPRDGGADLAEEHGLEVHSAARQLCPGTPTLFFTGYATPENLRDQLSSGGTGDVLGDGSSYALTQLLTKKELSACVERVGTYGHALEQLSASIRIDSPAVDLDRFEERALRLLARPLRGVSLTVEPLGGLSGATTFRVRILNGTQQLVGTFFGKITTFERIAKEREAYESYVTPLLGMGRYPALNRTISVGIGKREALFFQLAEEYSQSLFDLVTQKPDEAAALIRAVRSTAAPWSGLASLRPFTVGDLRREARMSDQEFEKHVDHLPGAREVEAVKYELSVCVQHGDLHGHNVLCKDSSDIVLIDFGRTREAPSCVDPILLEMSLIFHRDSPIHGGEWPTLEQAANWFELETYVENCPFGDLVRQCRAWANEAAGDARHVAVVAYAEAVRQLRYLDTDTDLARAIAKAAIEKIADDAVAP